MRRLPEALRLVRKPNEEASSEDFNAIRDALGVACHENAVFPSADEHDVLLDIQAAVAHKQSRKISATFNGLDLY